MTPESLDARRRDLVRQLTTSAELRWGKERAQLLAATIAATAESLAIVAAFAPDYDEAEPDFAG
jgi:hypothetical protein